MSDNKPPADIRIKCDGYDISIEDDTLVIHSPIPVEVKSAPAISNGTDELVSKADLDAAKAARLNQKWSKGRFYEGQGVYLGAYKLSSPEDKSLCRMFHAFAAQKDYPLCLDEADERGVEKVLYNQVSVNASLDALAKKQHETIFDNSGFRQVGAATVKYTPVPRVHGRSVMTLHDGVMHDGAHRGLWDVVERGAYKGEWFVPTSDMLARVVAPNLEKGVLCGSFNESSQVLDFKSSIYLSSSFDRGCDVTFGYDLHNKIPVHLHRSADEVSVRLVRLVPQS
jgi:hypothetical protein|tara:strand:- start:188439 stop:189284 length:846 start_codon:yes stop_codon:yes gene_type:complete